MISIDNQALRDLIHFQEVLGEMGFTIAGDGSYYKDYGLIGGGSTRIVPIFDRGLSSDSTYRLTAVSIANQIVIPIENNGKIPLDQVPGECISDVMKMIALMAPQSRMPLRESFILTSTCDLCEKDVASFLRKKDGIVVCLSCLNEY